MTRLLLALYPRSWRERYGSEVADLTDELVRTGETTPLRATLDLVAGAGVERWRVLARRKVWLALAVAGVVVALDVSRTRTGATRPYFATHPVGVLLLAVEVVWLLVELAEWRRGRHVRRSGDRQGQRRFGLAVGACVVLGTLSVNLAPSVVPSAAIQPGGVAFTAGLVMLIAGLGLRRWSFAALRGRYLNFSVVVDLGQPVVMDGPYRLLRHPGNAGMLLMCAGIGFTSANWAGLAAMTLFPLVVIVGRIRAEERVLLSPPGDRYRLVPLIW